MGSVMPLVALWELIKSDFDCVWIGSRRGMERAYIESLGIQYAPIPAGKLRHYLSVKTLLAPFFILAGFFVSAGLILVYRPKLIVVSGSFVSVPLVWAGYLAGILIIAHQEDIKVGLAGRLTMPFAAAVTTAFPETLKEIKNKNKFCIGNPVREIFSAQGGSAPGGQSPDTKKWQAPPAGDLPLVLVLGGGLGSQKINQTIEKIAPEIAGQARILHLTGKNKTVGVAKPYSGEEDKNVLLLKKEDIKRAYLSANILYDKGGEEHYNIISALHKSMRGSDADAALYWLARMLESGDDPLYVARRLVRFASEDIGLADPEALNQAVSAYQAAHFLGMPECNVILAQAVAYLARAPKSNALYMAYGEIQKDIKELPRDPVPLHLRNAPTNLMKDLGYGKEYKYPPRLAETRRREAGNPNFKEPVEQDYLPPGLRGKKYLKDK